MGESRGDREPERSVGLGVLVAPGLPEEVSARIADDLAEDLREAYGALAWRTEFVVDRLAVVVTDLPLRLGSRPVSRHVSRTHGVALVSLPALGPLHLKRRLRRVLRELAAELVGAGRSLREVAADADDASRFPYVPTVIFGHLRLLAGMVRANRPWRLAAKLYGVLAAAFAAGAYGVLASDMWRLSAALSWWRLLAVCLASLAVTIAAVIVAHELWERAPDTRTRAQVLLFNVTTVLTVTIGIAALYAALFALVLAGAVLVIAAPVFAHALGRDTSPRDYVTLAWFAASFATVPAHSARCSSRTPPSGRPPTREPPHPKTARPKSS
jgi:uncharacterized membrane protein